MHKRAAHGSTERTLLTVMSRRRSDCMANCRVVNKRLPQAWAAPMLATRRPDAGDELRRDTALYNTAARANGGLDRAGRHRLREGVTLLTRT